MVFDYVVMDEASQVDIKSVFELNTKYMFINQVFSFPFP